MAADFPFRPPSGLIDVHHHVVPDAYTTALARRGITKALGVPLPKWSTETMLAVLDRNAIESAVVSISAPGVYFRRLDDPMSFARDLARRMNEFCGDLTQRDPRRIGAFATLPLPDVEAAIAELEHALDTLKLDGVILMSNYDGHYLGDPKFEPLHAELNRRKAVAFVHPCTPPGQEQSHLGLPEAMLDVCFDTTRTAYSLIVSGVMKRHPDISFILAHAGGAVPYLAGRVSVTAKLLEGARGLGPAIGDAAGALSRTFPGLKPSMPDLLKYYISFKENVLPEGPAHFLKRFYYDTALSASPHVFGSLLTIAEPSRILFGTDYVFATEDAIPMTIEGLQEYPGLSPAQKAAIAKDNAATLFPRFATARDNGRPNVQRATP